MEHQQKTDDEMKSIFSRPNLILVNLVILVVFLLLVAGVYVWVVKKGKGKLIFPAGINYLSPKGDQSTTATTPMYDYAKLAESTDWATYKGKIFPFSFQHPKALAPLTFSNDQSDSVTFKLSDIPPELQLMFNVEKISARDGNLIGKQEEFVKSYWKFFSGLKGLNKIEQVTNEQGLKGYKANYTTQANTITGDSYFYVIEGDNDHLLHVANIFPVEGEVVFNRLLNSLEYSK